MRWILTGSETSSWNWGLQRAWTINAGLQDDAKLAADAEFNQVLDWLSSISPVTFFEINQIKGTDETKLAEASLDTLKEDNALSERAADPNAARVAGRDPRRVPVLRAARGSHRRAVGDRRHGRDAPAALPLPPSSRLTFRT